MSDVSAELPQDVLSDILIRLPVKSVGRSRCVSKVWLSLLTSYDFIKAHLAHHSRSLAQQQKILLCSSRGGPLFNLNLHLRGNHLRKLEFFNKELFHLVGSCNGLVSVVTRMNKLWLINCLTQEYVKVPDSPFPLCQCYVFKKYGFGYDELSDDMKIVKISQCDWGQGQFDEMPSCPGIFVDIYSLKMKSWRRHGTPLYGHNLLNYDSCVFIKGAFHWIGMKSKSLVIGAFNSCSDTFEEIPCPPLFGGGVEMSSTYKLMVIGGCLGMVISYRCPVEKTDIWYMKRYSVVDSWTKFVTIDNIHVCLHKAKILYQDRRSGDYKWYCVNDGSVKVCLEDDRRYLDEGITYCESLVSPHFYSQNSSFQLSKLTGGITTINLAI